jgi:putative flippase GtrA
MPALVHLLPPSARQAVSPDRLRALGEFLRFGLVGALGFIWDTATVYALAPWLGLYLAGIAAYVVAASINWMLNRIWTFRGAPRQRAALQWARFLAANLVGFVLNRGTYATLIATFVTCRTYPVLAVAAGSLAGLMANFLLSRRYVYR